MTLYLPLHLEGRRRREEPAFALTSTALSRAVSERSFTPVLEVSSQTRAEDILFAARIHGVSAILARLSEAAGVRGDLAEGLAYDLERSKRRAERLLQDARLLARRAADAGLPFVPLKGTYLFAERYEEPALRPMADLDLLASEESFEPWTRVLLGEGYLSATKGFKDWVFARPGARTPTDFSEHEDSPRPVELHFALPVRILGRTVDVTKLYRARLARVPLLGSVADVPDDDVLALHLLVHAAPSLVGRGLRLIQLHDFTKLRPTASAAALFRETLGPEVAWGLTRLVTRSLPGALPAEVLEGLAPPSAGRRRLWEKRPGLLLGREERTVLLRAELPLCRSLPTKLGRLRDAIPEPSFLERAYGNRGGARTWLRYYWDRVTR